MSGPYVYAPSAFEPTPYLGYGTYTQRSPFIPSAALYPSSPFPPSSPFRSSSPFRPSSPFRSSSPFRPSSPFRSSSPFRPSSPFRSSSPFRPSSPYLRPSTPQGVHFDDPYWNPPPRARRPSWHGGMPSSPFLSAPATPSHTRRRSFGGDFRPWEPASPWAGTSSLYQIHPLLNGEAPRIDFYFDLASPSFTPLRWVGPQRQSAVISANELREPATYPSIARMRISHDAIPQWPIDLEFDYDGYTAPTAPLPITLGDVLYMIHSSLHRQITHQDWARLGLSRETEIARAYTRRCKSVPALAQVEASRGVKRIDYLLDRHVFSGLIRTQDEDGFYQWRLITA